MTIRQRVEATRAVLAAAALVGATLVFLALANLHPVYGSVFAAIAAIAAIAVLWWWRGVFSFRRVLLWLEERIPELRYSLVALIDAPNTRFRRTLEGRVGDARFGNVVAIAGLRLVGLPLVFLLATQLVVRPIIARATSGDASAKELFPGGRSPSGEMTGNAKFAAIVNAPRYARINSDTVQNPTAVAALVGSDIRFVGRWKGEATMPKRPMVLRLQSGTTQRMVALEPRADSTPRVVLDLPARDTVLSSAGGAIRLAASARDDIGIVSGWFEVIISSGSGERFAFRTAILGRALGNGARELRLETVLRLDTMKLEPGDMMHLRAVARDANPASDAEAGSSETRTLRIYRVGESDSVSIEAGLPPEVGKSELSQRMLINMTEALVRQMRTIGRPALVTEARSIGQEQSRLRKRVGQIIFTRLGGDAAAEGDTTAESALSGALADTLSPGEALLRAASEATGAGAGNPLEEEGDEGGPVVGVNRPLLEAFNAMWEAERRLGVAEPREALPHMRAALAAIQKARAAERLYLRGRPPNIVLDIARLRLTGKREGIDPIGRAARTSIVAATLARQARFHAALELISREPAAAVDSLILLRVDVLSVDAALATSLAAAVDDLRSGRDATASLRAARRALTGEPASTIRGGRWSGAW